MMFAPTTLDKYDQFARINDCITYISNQKRPHHENLEYLFGLL